MRISSAGIVGARVRSGNGAEIGRIKKLRVSPESLNVYAIVEGERDGASAPLSGSFAIPLGALESAWGNDEFVVDFAALSRGFNHRAAIA